MAAPGHIDTSTGLVDNWTFARAYEPNPGHPDDPRYQQPIYSMAATTVQDESTGFSYRIRTGDGRRLERTELLSGDLDVPAAGIRRGGQQHQFVHAALDRHPGGVGGFGREPDGDARCLRAFLPEAEGILAPRGRPRGLDDGDGRPPDSIEAERRPPGVDRLEA